MQSMSGYFAISLKKQQKSKYNLCKHQFRGNLKIKNQSISPKRLVGIKSNISHHVLLIFWITNHCQKCLRLFPALLLREGEGCQVWNSIVLLTLIRKVPCVHSVCCRSLNWRAFRLKQDNQTNIKRWHKMSQNVPPSVIILHLQLPHN